MEKKTDAERKGRESAAAKEIHMLLHVKPHRNLIKYVAREDSNEDFVFLAIEFADKGSLEKYVTQIGRWSERKEVCRQLCEGLKALHQRGKDFYNYST